MRPNKWMLSTITLTALLVTVTAGACASPAAAGGAPAPAAVPSPAITPAVFTVKKNNRFYYRSQEAEKYTKAEYNLALSFMADGWQDMTIADFNAKLFPDIEAEDSFHAVYDPLQNVLFQYEEADPNAAFLDSLGHSVKEASILHYNACTHDQLPWMWGDAEYRRFEDVFGDKVQVAAGHVDFSYGYSFPDAAKITVGQRNAFFENMERGVQDFLDGQTEEDLKNESAMEEALAAELGRLAAQYGGSAVTVTGGEVGYYWEKFFD